MKLLDALYDIDWGKNVLMLIIYICTIFGIFEFYFRPILEEHKAQVFKIKGTYYLDNQMQKQVQDARNRLEEAIVSSLDARILFKQRLSNADLMDILNKYFTNISISSLEETKDDKLHLEQQSFLIKATAKSSKNLTEFIKNSKDLGLKLSYDVTIIKQEKGELNIKIIVFKNITDYKIRLQNIDI